MGITQSFQPYGGDGVSSQMWWGAEKASMSSLRGAPVINNGGYVDDPGTDPTSIIGVLMEDGHNEDSDGEHEVPIVLALPHQKFVGQVSTSIAQTDLFAGFGIVVDSSGYWTVDKAETTNKRVVICGFVDPVGTTNGRVIFTFIPAATVFVQATS